ncbi:hypothetical protein R1sor_017986 [Riccia sorocarpa]|uniref:Uncharacterized protein n=1 Tax=Riccia sorocarpa TaxID=122646 RepID=A0ABD3IEM3_9MARC
MSGRSCYYSHKQLAIDEPSLYKLSIHDGMDSNKMAIPRLDNYVKALSGVGMLVPVKIAGILNRGHGPPSIAHIASLRRGDFSVVPPLDQEPLSSGMASNHAATEDIVTYLKAYIKHIKSIRDKTNPSSECYETDTTIIAYWENIKSLFEEPKDMATNAVLPLKEGFWPRTNHGTGYKRLGNQIIITSTPEDDILAQKADEELVERNQLLVGNLAEMERERFVHIVDIEPSVMLLIRPSDDFVMKDYFWVAKAVFGVIQQRKPSDPISMYEVNVEWYRPKHRSSNATDAQRHNQCLCNTQEWEKDHSSFEEEFLYVDASACVHQWKSKSRSDKLKIPKSILRIARDMLDRIAQEEI